MEEGSRVKIPQSVLHDLCSRFLINIPEEEKTDMVRICFQIELAHWFYIDFCRQEDLDLPACGMQEFMKIIFVKFPFLKNTDDSIEMIFENWKRYKVRVPVFGAILLDQSLTKCLLVQGFHNKASWGFPKGKVNKDEEGFDCAVREVKEETGFDIKEYADPKEFIEHNLLDHQVRLYVVPGVPLNSDFQPKTRGEIKEIKWFAVEDLPAHKKDTTSKEKLGVSAGSFYLVQPFVRPLRKWINQHSGSATPRSGERIEMSQSGRQGVARRGHQATDPDSTREHAEMQRRFQEMHRLSHPLRSTSMGSEQHLLGLLGIRDSGASWENKLQDSSIESPRKPPENQPEPIRKLLLGTVTPSPVTTPEKGGFLLQDTPVGQRSRSSPRQRNSLPMSLDTRSVTRRLNFAAPSLETKSVEETSSSPRKSSPKKRNSLALAKSRTQTSWPDPVVMPKTGSVKLSKEADDSAENLISLLEFSFRAPAWTNFSFSKSEILATLPP